MKRFEQMDVRIRKKEEWNQHHYISLKFKKKADKAVSINNTSVKDEMQIQEHFLKIHFFFLPNENKPLFFFLLSFDWFSCKIWLNIMTPYRSLDE